MPRKYDGLFIVQLEEHIVVHIEILLIFDNHVIAVGLALNLGRCAWLIGDGWRIRRGSIGRVLRSDQGSGTSSRHADRREIFAVEIQVLSNEYQLRNRLNIEPETHRSIIRKRIRAFGKRIRRVIHALNSTQSKADKRNKSQIELTDFGPSCESRLWKTNLAPLPHSL